MSSPIVPGSLVVVADNTAWIWGSLVDVSGDSRQWSSKYRGQNLIGEAHFFDLLVVLYVVPDDPWVFVRSNTTMGWLSVQNYRLVHA